MDWDKLRIFHSAAEAGSFTHAGESLRVVVKGMDIYRDALPNLPFARHEDLRNAGTHIIHAGGEHDSHLLVPVVPPRPA
ncbi:MAG: hypothetical protein ABS35_44645 [Kaistia sp. SCN 65-12]|nr:MAG: hypothetical protein ABS35_44645 [Kaistia sp. SCN 65-12]